MDECMIGATDRSLVDPSQAAVDVTPWERRYSTWIYVATCAATILSVAGAPATFGIALLGFPLTATVMWLLGRRESAFVDTHGRNAFGITMTILLVPLLGFVFGPFGFLV